MSRFKFNLLIWLAGRDCVVINAQVGPGLRISAKPGQKINIAHSDLNDHNVVIVNNRT